MPGGRVRRAQPRDAPRLMPVLLAEARARAALEPLLWPLHAKAHERLLDVLQSDFSRPERRAWFLAEQRGVVVGVAEVGRYPAPPVYAELLAGLTGDLWHAHTPTALTALLAACEDFGRSGQVACLNAACPAQDAHKLDLLRAHGYRPLTLWMTCKVEPSAPLPAHVRPATEADVPAMVRLNAAAQEGKRHANPRFWTPHAEAQARFAPWMRHSLTMADRDMLVSEQRGLVNGFVIVQPTNLPPAHDPSGVATLDDLAADDWETFRALLGAAHHVGARRGLSTLQAICPAAWPERVQALTEAGFRTANLWLMKG